MYEAFFSSNGEFLGWDVYTRLEIDAAIEVRPHRSI